MKLPTAHLRFVLLGSALLAGCAAASGGGPQAAQSAPTEERRVVFDCDRGDPVAITFAGDVARIEADGPPIILRQQPAASGFLYESATHAIRGKGDDLTYTIGRMAPLNCRAR